MCIRDRCKLDFHWIRLHYLYPDDITDELIDTIAQEEKIVPYLDIPCLLYTSRCV